MSWTCPLTPLENALRIRAGQTGYAGGFVQRYIGPVVYPRGMPRRLDLVAGVSVLAWNIFVYAIVLCLTQDLEGAGVQSPRPFRSLIRFGSHAEPSVRVREIDVDPRVVRIRLCSDKQLLQRGLEILLTMEAHPAPQRGIRVDGVASRARWRDRSPGAGRRGGLRFRRGSWLRSDAHQRAVRQPHLLDSVPVDDLETQQGNALIRKRKDLFVLYPVLDGAERVIASAVVGGPRPGLELDDAPAKHDFAHRTARIGEHPHQL